MITRSRAALKEVQQAVAPVRKVNKKIEVVSVQQAVAPVRKVNKKIEVVSLSSSEGESSEAESSTCDDTLDQSNEDGSDFDVVGKASDGEQRTATGIDDVLYKEVLEVVQGGDLTKLKVDHCKQYLRMHGLRMSGTKAVLLDRIKQHLEIKEGKFDERLKPSTFCIHCTGDVCCGDVVMFTQKVYEKFDIASRRAAPLGKRVVAGRVVKESYGFQKQQHTFTVEVLWSKGLKSLAPMQQLLVKGRNLYRNKTMRQPWANEEERKAKLLEKHRRGASARSIRAEGKSFGRRKGMSKADFEEKIAQKPSGNPYIAVQPQMNASMESTQVAFQGRVQPQMNASMGWPGVAFHNRALPQMDVPMGRTQPQMGGTHFALLDFLDMSLTKVNTKPGGNKPSNGPAQRTNSFKQKPRPLKCSNSSCVRKGSRDCLLAACYHCCKTKSFDSGRCSRHLMPGRRPWNNAVG